MIMNMRQPPAASGSQNGMRFGLESSRRVFVADRDCFSRRWVKQVLKVTSLISVLETFEDEQAA
jgi:hypothetical protein